MESAPKQSFYDLEASDFYHLDKETQWHGVRSAYVHAVVKFG
jgi:hypothetical protein